MQAIPLPETLVEYKTTVVVELQSRREKPHPFTPWSKEQEPDYCINKEKSIWSWYSAGPQIEPSTHN